MSTTMRLPGMVVTDHSFSVPLDHAAPDDHRPITVFAREIVAPDKTDADLPWLVYLQGGPGGKAPRPTGRSGWLGRALRDYRVLLLDQRGTGRSTPVTAEQAAQFPDADTLARYLRHFRADSIVADAEAIRARLSPDQPWTTLGQSYGGFITLTYLSNAPQGLRRCYVTGGLAGLTAAAEEVYARTYPRVAAKNRRYFGRYPDDAARVRAIAEQLAGNDVRLPDGDRLSVERFRFLGIAFGMGAGFEQVHWLIDEAWEGTQLSRTFRHAVMVETSFDTRPLYAVLQEAIYAQDDHPTGWAAARLLDTYPEFAVAADPLLFTGEMVYPWMFRDIGALRPFAAAADVLADARDWTPLYDPARLAANDVPVAAIAYHDDMFVDVDLSLDTAAKLGNVATWVTNQWEHDGSNRSEGAVLDRLIQLADDLPQTTR